MLQDSKRERKVIESQVITFSIEKVRHLLMKEAAEKGQLDWKYVGLSDQEATGENAVMIVFNFDPQQNTISAIQLKREWLVSVEDLDATKTVVAPS